MNKHNIATITVICGFIVFGLKLMAFFISGSIALLSDALESIVNIIASIMMFVSVRISSKPADESHHYGHEKVENISAFIEGSLVIVAALLITYAAITRLINPSFELFEINIAVGVSFLAMFTNLGLSVILGRIAKETGSSALEGDSKHLLSDVFSTIAVNIGLLIASFTGWKILDPLLALIVAFLVGKMGLDLVLKQGSQLLDQSAAEEEEKIHEILNTHVSQFVGYHNFKTRRIGNKIYAELHLNMKPDLSIQEAHDFTEHLQEDFKKEIPELVLNIHVEPPTTKTSD